MGYLISNDYDRLIQDASLQQIISGNPILQLKAENTAITEFKSYLRAKYDVDKEFTNTQVYNPQATYSAADRVYLDALAYNSGATYTQGQLALQNGKVYQCTTLIAIPEAFNPAHWVLLGNQYDIFYANYPFPVFNLLKNYSIGDKVFWNNHTYTCKIATQLISQDMLIQYSATNQVPFQNVFPDDLKLGSQFWTDNGIFVIPAGNLLTTTPTETVTLFQARDDLYLITGTTPNLVSGTNSYTAPAQGQPGSLIGWNYSIERPGGGTIYPGIDYTKNANGFTLLNGASFNPGEKFVLHFVPITDEPVPVDTTGLNASQIIMTYFTNGDNRNQQIVSYLLDCVIYNLYSRIPPQIVPENRIFRYQMAIKWLQNVAKGDEIVADIVKLQPPQGSRIRFSSRPKQQNYY